MRWNPFIYEEQSYSLDHLHSIEFQYLQESKGDKKAITYDVAVMFSLHCFTRGMTEEERSCVDMHYSDGRETRVFDFDRYQLSLQLPEIIRGLGGRKCFHARDNNFLTVKVLDDKQQPKEYEIYFTVSKSSRRGWLNLFVQSAYIRDEKHGGRPNRKSNRKPIQFQIILYNILNGRSISRPL